MSQTMIRITPFNFYQLADLMATVKPSEMQSMRQVLAEQSQALEDRFVELDQAHTLLMNETRLTTRQKPQPEDMLEHMLQDTAPKRSGSFVHVLHEVVSMIREGYLKAEQVLDSLTPKALIMMDRRLNGMPSTMEEIQIWTFQTQMNDRAIGAFVDGALGAEQFGTQMGRVGFYVIKALEQWQETLTRRHTIEGVRIFSEPIVTDLAIAVFDNIDAHGEIQAGMQPDEISIWSMRKATALLDASTNTPIIRKFIENPNDLIPFIKGHLENLARLGESVSKHVVPYINQIETLLDMPKKRRANLDRNGFWLVAGDILHLDPKAVQYKERTGLMTADEIEDLAFRNETLEDLVLTILTKSPTEEIVKMVLGRKAKRRKIELNENSFFTCKISAGNPFGGEAPGALSLVPAPKPNVTLNDVVGSGYDDIREFIATVGDSAKWHDLFLVTSPSRKADKSNVLLVGPPGSGKTEVLRALGSDPNSIGVFAQASDFLTCWKGEAEKNPKRLFEGGLKLQKESGKQVFFLIDEIDTILNDNQGYNAFGGANLATEFQVLMDGITTYPNLALWGATNHPERIPLPLIRRFAKVSLVGELNQQDRIVLLKQFCSTMPIAVDFPELAWASAATSLDGAVGDTVRKLADDLWRMKMRAFVKKNPAQAETLAKELNANGKKFQLGKFSHGEREALHERLRPHVEIGPNDVAGVLARMLKEVSIQAEIQTAKNTYAHARSFLGGLS